MYFQSRTLRLCLGEGKESKMDGEINWEEREESDNLFLLGQIKVGI